MNGIENTIKSIADTIQSTHDNIINHNMNTIKFTSKTTCRLNGIDYKGYTVGELPNSFGFLYNQDKESYGKSHWFNYKGLTWLEKTELPW